MTGWSPSRKKLTTDSCRNIMHTLWSSKESTDWGSRLLSISLSFSIALASVWDTIITCPTLVVYSGAMSKDWTPVVFWCFWGCSCLDFSLSLRSSPFLRSRGKLRSSSSINSRYRLSPITERLSLGPSSFNWGSRLSAPAVRKPEVGTLMTVFALPLGHVAHKPLVKYLACLSLPHSMQDAILCSWWLFFLVYSVVEAWSIPIKKYC